MSYCPFCAEKLADVDVANQVNTYSDGQTRAADEKTDAFSEGKTVYGGNGQDVYAPPGGYKLNDPYANREKTCNNQYDNIAGTNAQPNRSSGGVPPIQPPGNYTPPAHQPPQNSGGNNKGLYVLIGIFAGIIVVAGVIILLLLSDGGSEPTHEHDDVVVETEYETLNQSQQSETATQPVTQAPTTNATVPDTEKLNAYYVFNDFYISYLDGINYLESSMIDHCSQSVRYEMLERFEYNKKSLFDLRRIDFDEASYSSSKSGDKTYHHFYVKCVSEYYDRNTYENKGYNYAVWYVTVTEENGYSYVSSLERNDKYKMGTVVHTITDYSELTFF